jgi:hypothetical protein
VIKIAQEQERKSSRSGKTKTIPKGERDEEKTEKTGFTSYKTYEKEIVGIAKN